MVLPLLAAATLGAGALSAISGNSAAKKAAKASQYATDQANALQREQFDRVQRNLSPYMEAGKTGLNALQTQAQQPMPTAYQDPGYTAPQAFSYGAQDYQESPGLKFAIERGLGAINSRAAANGSMYSGAALKGAGEFVANTMLKDFQNERAFAQGQYTDQRNFGRANYLDDRNFGQNQYTDARNYQGGVISGLANLGANAAAGVGTAGQNYANSAGNALQQNAVNQGNAGLVASSNFSNLLGQGLGAVAYGGMPTSTPSITPFSAPANPLAGMRDFTPLTNGAQLGSIASRYMY